MALAAEGELWDAYVARTAAEPAPGPILDTLRRSFTATLRDLDDDWLHRFALTRALTARTPGGVLRHHSELLTLRTQARIVQALERRFGIDGRTDVRLRLLGDMAMSAWRCGARNWTAGRGHPGFVEDRGKPRPETRTPHDPPAAAAFAANRGGRAALIARVEEAFTAIPPALSLHPPQPPAR